MINYDVPTERNSREPNYDTYMHRIGRSGRFGRKGVAFNFIAQPEVGLQGKRRQAQGRCRKVVLWVEGAPSMASRQGLSLCWLGQGLSLGRGCHYRQGPSLCSLGQGPAAGMAVIEGDRRPVMAKRQTLMTAKSATGHGSPFWLTLRLLQCHAPAQA